jgi:hypothetical protein
MRRFTSRALLLVSFATTAAAQSTPILKLKPAAAKLDAEFSSIVAVRELADGRALVADLTENKVVVVDFGKGAVTQIGRSGQGPGEYQNPQWLYRLGGDSSLLVERRTSRWHLLSGDKVVATIPPDNAAYIAMRRQALGTDARGSVVALSSFADNKGASVPMTGNGPDSSWIVRANRGSARVDTLGRVRAPKSIITSTTNARGELTSMSVARPPFSVGEEIALFDDGWLAVVRLEPYRVDWIAPDGKVTKGRPLPWPTIALTRADVEQFYAVRSRSAGVTPEMAASMQRSIDAGVKNAPEFIPPLAVGGLMPADDGQLLIRHPATAAQANARYDLVDRSGRLRGTIVLDKGESITAVSRKWAYVVYVDDDGLNFLRRHPWQSVSVAP